HPVGGRAGRRAHRGARDRGGGGRAGARRDRRRAREHGGPGMSGTALRTSSALRRATAAVLVVVGLLAAVPVTAGATGSGHDGSASCVARVDRRIKDVDKLLGKVATAPDVTASHRATLTQPLQAARDGLVALRAEILALTPTVAAYHEDQGPTTTLAPEV